MKKSSLQKTLVGFLSLSAAGLLALPALVSADITPDTSSSGAGYGLGSGFTTAGLGKRDVKATVGDIINIVLGVLGIIAVIIILAGGFKWMTAGGNEDKVGEARKMIIQGVIGLVVIFAAWGIASFVINQLSSASQPRVNPDLS